MVKGFAGTVIAVASIVVIAVPAFFLTAPIVNDRIAEQTADKLADLPLPDHTEMLESVYEAGKLTGNGNGMQYFGAILIQSEIGRAHV